MSRLLSIDLGVRYIGAAWWADGRLVVAERVAAPRTRTDGEARRLLARELLARAEVLDPDGDAAIVCETPQNYGSRASCYADLDRMRGTATILRAWLGPSSRWRMVLPREWKGNVPKRVHHERVRDQLDAAEAAVVQWGDLDVLDAVALGLWAVGRVGRGGVRPERGAP